MSTSDKNFRQNFFFFIQFLYSAEGFFFGDCCQEGMKDYIMEWKQDLKNFYTATSDERGEKEGETSRNLAIFDVIAIHFTF